VFILFRAASDEANALNLNYFKMIETTMANSTATPTAHASKQANKRAPKGTKKGELASNTPIFLRVSAVSRPTVILYCLYVQQNCGIDPHQEW
jgi:hypothetical protein